MPFRWSVVGMGIVLVIGACGTSKPKFGLPPASEGSGGSGGGTSSSGGRGGADAGAVDGGDVSYGIDCPAPSPASVPESSPRILVLGPAKYPDTIALAAALQGMLDRDGTFKSPVVEAETIDQVQDGGSGLGGRSLMYYFYDPSSRARRLAALSQPWSYVVLLEQADYAVAYPEFYFEGVRVLGCAARAAGAKPVVLMSWPTYAGELGDVPTRGPIAYRVANGTGSVLAPAGYAWAAARPEAGVFPPGGELYLAAATLYSTLTGRDAASTHYTPSGLEASEAKTLGAAALATVEHEATVEHYDTPYRGVVQLQKLPPGGAFRYMSWGTSSEALWQGDMATLVPLAGFTAQPTQLQAPEGSPQCEASCLAAATPPLQMAQYDLLYARYYALDAGTFRAIGQQSALQVQVWDRHADNIPMDGVVAVEMMEDMLLGTYDEAKSLGLAHTPYHLMFSKLKTMRPTVQLTRDGTHATPAVAYGQATMSLVSRTGISTPTAGLEADTALCSQLGDETIRQLASLSVSGTLVPDDPASRPKSH